MVQVWFLGNLLLSWQHLSLAKVRRASCRNQQAGLPGLREVGFGLQFLFILS